MKLRIATWNIGEDETNDKNIVNMESYKFIEEVIKKYNIDIICFQEAITSSSTIEAIKDFVKKTTELVYSSEFEYAPSHINIGSMMGIVTCSKFPVSRDRVIMFDNPHIEYVKSETVTYKMHDKGFVVSYIDSIPLVIANGHGMPFFVFKRDALDFLDMYHKMERDLINEIGNESNFIIIGDINHTSFKEIYPNIYNITNNNIEGITYTHYSNGEDMQLDYIMTSKNIKVENNKIIDNRFDHKLCMVDIEV